MLYINPTAEENLKDKAHTQINMRAVYKRLDKLIQFVMIGLVSGFSGGFPSIVCTNGIQFPAVAKTINSACVGI